LLPSSWLSGRLDCNVDVVIRQHLQKVLIGSKIHLGTTTVGLHNLSCSTIRGEQHATDLILLNRLNKIAISQRASSRCRVRTVKECRANNDYYHYEEDVKPYISPTLVQGSSPLMKEC
jgi:hypothetical protein